MHLDRGLVLARNIGHRRLELDLLSFRRSALYIQGEYALSAEANDVYRDAVLASSDDQHQYFMRIALGEFALRLSDFESAASLFDEAGEKLSPEGYILGYGCQLTLEIFSCVRRFRSTVGLPDRTHEVFEREFIGASPKSEV